MKLHCRNKRLMTLAVLGLAVGWGALVQAAIAPFRDGERIAFLGDSITAFNHYIADVQFAMDLRRGPKAPYFMNCGTAGDGAYGAAERIACDLLTMRPDRVIVMLGMNDNGYDSWKEDPVSDKLRAAHGRRLAFYRKKMGELVDALQKRGLKVDLMTPSPFDEYSTDLKRETRPHCNETGLSDFAQAVRELAAGKKLGLVEVHAPMTAIEKAHPTKLHYSGPDRVHPSPAGNRFMAAAVLAAADEVPGSVLTVEGVERLFATPKGSDEERLWTAMALVRKEMERIRALVYCDRFVKGMTGKEVDLADITPAADAVAKWVDAEIARGTDAGRAKRLRKVKADYRATRTKVPAYQDALEKSHRETLEKWLATHDGLKAGFLDPPHEAKPHTWYHMMNGNVTKEGITRDFEALAEIGVGGVQMFDAGCEIPPGLLAFNSPEWFDLLKHAATEAKRLGLEICLPNCSGWSSSGGPWVKPEDGMMVLDSTRTEVLTGPAEFRGKLARPPFAADRAKFYRDLAVVAVPVPEAETRVFPGESKSLDGLRAAFEAAEPVTAGGIEFRYRYDRTYGIYGKILVETSEDGRTFAELGRFESNPCVMCVKDESLRTLRFPKRVTFRALRVKYLFESGSLLEANLRITDLRPTDRVELSLARAKRFEVRNDVVRDGFPTTPDQVVSSAKCVSLTDRMKPDGTLEWSVPAGKWRICRIGYKANGRQNHPASRFGVGLEVDKLSAAALGRHFDSYIGRLCDHLGPDLCGNHPYGLNNILVDSYEVGSQNWTPGLERLFRERMGYDLAPYWPVLLGYIVDSTDVSERFLEDYRRLICDLFAENYAGALAEKCHARGLQLSLEPYGNSPSDNLQYGASADIPMGEFWSHARNPWPNACGNVKFVISLAHVWGRRFVGAEAFTASGSRPGGGDNGPGSGGWMTTPFDLKAQGDTAFCSGVNRIIYHRFVHQPWTDVPRLPGMTMGKWGMHFDRTQTWWKEGAEWIRYQSRCQWMLQQGDFVADFLVFCGEETPNRGGDNTDSSKPSPAAGIPAGYDWDVATREAVKALKAEGGLMVAPGGTRYRVLVLPASDTMSPEMLGEVGRLIDAGVTVVGPKRPVRAPGLRNAAARDAETRRLADAIWAKGVHPSIAAVLSAIRLEPDCTLAYGKAKDAIAPHWIHRRDGKADWYFIAANNREPMTFTASLRGDFPAVELWDPEKGTVVRAAHVRRTAGRTEVTFDLPVAGSVFAVGRSNSSAPVEKKSVVTEEIPVEGAWQVSFPNGFKPNALAKGADETVSFETLADWATHADERIRGFSGSAVYRKTVRLDDATWTAVTSGASRIVLDLGDVKHFATVTVNGRTYPALWKPPYRLDITPDSPNLALAIRVTNLWANKLIADDKKSEDCEWTENRIHGDAIKGIPAWVNEGRPSPTGRDTFVTWRHWRGTDRPQPSGLIGPVKIVRMK